MNNDIRYIYKGMLLATAIFSVIVALGVGVFVFLYHPIPVLADANAVREADHGTLETSMTVPESAGAAGAEAPSAAVGNKLTLDGDSNDSDYIWIPVMDGISSTDIVIENHYMDRQLWVAITGSNEAFYADNPVSGNLDAVSEAEAVDTEQGTVLKFTFDRVYEFNTIFENGVLYVDTLMPGEVYDRIVVIDPAGFVPDGMITDNSLTPARICLDIANRLKEQLDKQNIKVYMTSVDERVRDSQSSLALLGEVRPDMYIRIETAYDEDTSVYGTSTVYNGTYFIPGFGSVELADLLEAYVTTSIGGKALGMLQASDEDTVISMATVPAATVRVGYYTNAQENILLNREDYRTRIAEGIYNAIMQAYGE